ncbi:MAG: hypothetical protein JW882_18920, partial [Deltaproteobacteria bacterium]|nr:hypothetical protein [Deltaproteobacteria bacterium]
QGELGTDSVRLFVAYYKELPFTPEEGTLITDSAVQILESRVALTEDQKAFLSDRLIKLSDLKKPPAEEATAETEVHETTEEFAVKGMTTFQDLLDFGITKEEIEKIFGLPMGRTGENLRDFSSSNGLELSEFRPMIEALAASKK